MGKIKIEFIRNPYIINIYDDNILLKTMYFENAVDFITRLHILESKNDQEIYDYCKSCG